MPTPADDLSTILYQLTLGLPEDPSGGYHEDSSRLDFLVQTVKQAEAGIYDHDEVVEIFRRYGPSNFDYEGWHQEQVAAGHYFDPNESYESPDVPEAPRGRSGWTPVVHNGRSTE